MTDHVLKITALAGALLFSTALAQADRVADDVELSPFPGAQVLERTWAVDLDYATEDYRSVFEFYDAELQRQGWEQVTIYEDDAEIDAEYRLNGVRLELELELDSDGYTELELDLEEVTISEGSFSLYRWPNFELTLMPDVELLDRAWVLDTEYATEDFAAVFSHYDGLLQGADWERTDLSESDDGRDADYVRGNLDAELEVDLDDGRTEVELEVDQRN